MELFRKKLLDFIKKRNQALIVLFVMVAFVFVSIAFSISAQAYEYNTSSHQALYEQISNKRLGDDPAGMGGLVGNGDGGWFLDAILSAISFVLFWILSLVVKLVTLAVWFLEVMMTPELYQKTLTMSAVSTGWELVRDFLNMFFILIILFIAISTILRIEKYDARKMLYRVILAALLINFSKPIALFFIDISQLAMGFFMNNISSQFASYGTTLMDSTKLQNSFSASGGTQVEYIISMIFAIVFLFVFAVMIFILALGLFLRLIAFLVLIVLSPFAFFGMTLPGTPLGSSWDNWLKKMTNWGFFGPVLLFFLWLALVIIDGVNDSGIVSSVITSSGNVDLGTTMSKILTMFIPYVFAIYLLWYGYDTAGKMAKEAGESARKLWNKGEKWATDWNRRAAYGAAAVGTLGAAPAVYYGGRALKRRAESELKGVGQGIKKGAKKYKATKWMVPESDDERKDREAKRAAHTAKRLGNEDEYNKYYRGKAAEIRKDWKEKAPMPDKKLEEIMMTDKNMAKRRAAAMELAERGKLDNKNKFAGAMAAAEKDDGLKKKIRELAEKKNMHAAIEHDIDEDKERLLNERSTEMKDETIERMIRMRKENYERNAGVGAFTAVMENTMRSNLQAETSNQFKARLQAMSKGEFRQLIYDEKLDDMTIKEIKDQDINFHRDGAFGDYMWRKTNLSDARFKQNKLDDVVSKGEVDAKKAAAWKIHRII